MTVRRERAHLLDGRVSWLAAGERVAGQPTIVCLHGIPSSAELWRGVLERLGAAGWHAIAPDLPGYGRTRIDASRDHGIEGMVDVVEALVEHFELGPVWIVGHDIGGGAAQLLAVDRPELVARLTLTNSVAADLWPPPLMRPVLATARRGLARVVGPVLATTTAAAVRRGLVGASGGPGAWSMADSRRVFLDGKVSTPTGRAAFARHVTAVAHANNALTARVAPHLADLDVPTQLVWGNADTNLPWERVGVALRDLLPNPSVTVLDGAGHFVPGERPQQLAAALLAGV